MSNKHLFSEQTKKKKNENSVYKIIYTKTHNKLDQLLTKHVYHKNGEEKNYRYCTMACDYPRVYT